MASQSGVSRAADLAGAQGALKGLWPWTLVCRTEAASLYIIFICTFIYRIGIYRYKQNQSKTAVKAFRLSSWPLLKTSTVGQQG